MKFKIGEDKLINNATKDRKSQQGHKSSYHKSRQGSPKPTKFEKVDTAKR